MLPGLLSSAKTNKIKLYWNWIFKTDKNFTDVLQTYNEVVHRRETSKFRWDKTLIKISWMTCHIFNQNIFTSIFTFYKISDFPNSKIHWIGIHSWVQRTYMQFHQSVISLLTSTLPHKYITLLAFFKVNCSIIHIQLSQKRLIFLYHANTSFEQSLIYLPTWNIKKNIQSSCLLFLWRTTCNLLFKQIVQ